MSVQPEALVASTFREYLLRKLPSSCAVVNASRAAVLQAPVAGPYVIPGSAVLKLSITDKAGTTISAPLTSGTRTAAEVAADVELVAPGVATADSLARFVLTSTTAPSFNAALDLTNSVIAVGPDETGANAALGFDVAGEYVIRTPVTPPNGLGVLDGMPVGDFFEVAQLGKGRVLLTIGERTSAPHKLNPRNFEWDVTLDVGIFRSEPLTNIHQTREHIQAALRAVREVLVTDDGKQLGRASPGDIVFFYETSCRVSPWPFEKRPAQRGGPAGPQFDAINVKYLARVYAPPS